MIVVGGEALVDLVIDPDGGVTAKLGGGPFNAARAIGRLGSEVAFLGALSGDRFGTLLHRQLLADGVDDSLIQFTELPTTLASAELDAHGSASYHFYIAETAAPNLHLPPLPDDVGILHVGTLGMVLEPMATTLEAVVGNIGDDVLVLLDPNCRPRVTADRVGYLARLDRMLRRADVVKVSTDDLDFIAPDDHGSGVQLTARRWCDRRAAHRWRSQRAHPQRTRRGRSTGALGDGRRHHRSRRFLRRSIRGLVGSIGPRSQ